MKYDIIIIDSGYNKALPGFENKHIDSFGMMLDNSDKIIITKECMDYIGHGSGVLKIILDAAPHAKIAVIKIFHTVNQISVKLLHKALEYVYENMSTDLINLSCNISSDSEYTSLQDICNKLTSLGTVIVAACSNDNLIGFPAGCKNVIGVDFHNTTSSIFYIKNSWANIFIPTKSWLIQTTPNQFKRVSSTSFATPEVVGMLYNIKRKTPYKNITELENILINNSKYISFSKLVTQPKQKIIIYTINDFQFIIEMLKHIGNSCVVRIATHPLSRVSSLEVESWKNLDLLNSADVVVFYGIDDLNPVLGCRLYNEIISICNRNDITVFNASANCVLPQLISKNYDVLDANKVNILKKWCKYNINTIVIMCSHVQSEYYLFWDWLITQLRFAFSTHEMEFLFLNSVLALCNSCHTQGAYIPSENKYQQLYYYVYYAKYHAFVSGKKMILAEYPVDISLDFEPSCNMITSIQMVKMLAPCATCILINDLVYVEKQVEQYFLIKATQNKAFVVITPTASSDFSSITSDLKKRIGMDFYDLRQYYEKNRLILNLFSFLGVEGTEYEKIEEILS